MTNGSSLLGFSNVGSGMGAYTSTSLYNVSVGNTTSGNYNTTTKAMGVTTDASKSGLIGSVSLQNTTKEFYLYICVGNAVVNEALVDIGQLSSDLQYKADKTEVDGQWVSYYGNLINSSTALTNSGLVFDLSSHIPDDGYTYECLFSIAARTGTSSGNQLGIMVTDACQSVARVAHATTRTSSYASAAGQFLAIIDNNRKITIAEESGSQTSYVMIFRMHAYRRIGTNI